MYNFKEVHVLRNSLMKNEKRERIAAYKEIYITNSDLQIFRKS